MSSRRFERGEHVARVGVGQGLPAFTADGPWIGDFWYQNDPFFQLMWQVVPDGLTPGGRQWITVGRPGDWTFEAPVGVGVFTAVRAIGNFQVAAANTPGAPALGISITSAIPGGRVSVSFSGLTPWIIGAAPVVAGDILTPDANGFAIAVTAMTVPVLGPVVGSVACGVCISGGNAGDTCLCIFGLFPIPATIV